ncbi:MAG TPA: DUF4136 domain-containing protein [Burkholderiaceae bacterium]|jgi:hypothetical protein|nr:DUF4136 domain-containing protein [Burkholderiaceae bacterium]
MKRCSLVLLVMAGTLLVGCASPKIRSEVTVFQDWPTDLREQSFVFERTRNQANNLEYRNYENLVRNELHRLGFTDATSQDTAKLKVSMNYGISTRDVRVIEPVIVDPLWYGAPMYGPRWGGYYGPYWPYYDPFWYGPPITEYRESNYELFKRQLHVAISRAADGKNIYDVTVVSEGRNGSLAAVMPYMVHSAFLDFPGKSGTTRRVELKMKN